MKRIITAFVLLFLIACKKEQKIDTSIVGRSEVETVLEVDLDKILENKYSVFNKITPNELVADFDGDGKEGRVLIVKETLSEKLGLLFLHSNGTHYMIGAGKVFTKDGWDNMNWLGVFEIESNKKQSKVIFNEETYELISEEEIILPNIAVSIRAKEGSGGLLYFDGKKYQYLHQGD